MNEKASRLNLSILALSLIRALFRGEGGEG